MAMQEEKVVTRSAALSTKETGRNAPKDADREAADRPTEEEDEGEGSQFDYITPATICWTVHGWRVTAKAGD